MPTKKQSVSRPGVQVTPTKKRIVSAARAAERPKPLSLRLPQRRLDELTTIAASLHLSRSHMVVRAIDRCMGDGVWAAGGFSGASPNDGRPSRDLLVDLSNVLVQLAFAAQESIDAADDDRRAQARGMVDDALKKLNAVRRTLAC